MFLQNWWYTTLLGTPLDITPPLRGDVKADVLIVGAGATGLAAALRCMGAGLDVIVIDKNICGGSSTGKSAGFLTPDSELELSEVLRRYGPRGARDLWECAQWGCDRIAAVIREHGIDADLQAQDCLFLGEGSGGPRQVRDEYAARRSMGYDVEAYDAAELKSIIGAIGFTSAVRYRNTAAINAMRYAQGVKRILVEHGVHVYESTEAISLEGHEVTTHLGKVTADRILFCADKLPRSLTAHYWNTYWAQTFLAISEPLQPHEVTAMFPAGPLMCWDSHFDYSYWRLTGDNRILLGGDSLWSTYAGKDTWTASIIQRVIRRFRARWPSVDHVHFRQFWMGRIDATRDLMPTILRDEHAPWVHYVLGCVGLPWATFCGDFAARHALSEGGHDDDHYYRYFSIDRGFLVPLWLERILGRRISFVVNQAYAKYVQVDKQFF